MSDVAINIDGELAVEPPFTDEHLAKLPAKRGVALLTADGDRPIVLLPAADLRSRIAARMRNPDEDPRQKMPDLRGITRKVLWKLTGGHFETDWVFLEWSRRIWPREYPRLLAFKKAAFVHVDPAAEFPRFARTDDILRGEGVSPSFVGPEGAQELSRGRKPPESGPIAQSPEGATETLSRPVSDSFAPSGLQPLEAGNRGLTPPANISRPFGPEEEGGQDARQTREQDAPATHGQDARATATGGLCVGPFPSGRAAERFIDVLQDAFDLCRDYRCLRQSPRGTRCSYGQMGRCLCPCDGSISMELYRGIVAEAAAFAAGDRSTIDRIKAEMKQAAAALQFEKAAKLKARIERLAALDHEDFRLVRPLSDFRFLLIQGGLVAKKAHVFFADGGTIAQLPSIDRPPKKEQITALLASLASSRDREGAGQATSPLHDDDAIRQWRIALVSHYLYCSPQKSGVILRHSAALSADEIVARMAEIMPPRAKPETGPTPEAAEKTDNAGG